MERARRLRRARLRRPAGLFRHRRLSGHPARGGGLSRVSVPHRGRGRRRAARGPGLLLHAAAAGRRILDRHVGARRGAASHGQSGPSGPGRDRHLDDLARRFSRRRPARSELLAVVGLDACAGRRDLRPVAQSVRRLGAGDPRRRGGGGLDRRQGPRHQADRVHSGRLRLRAGRRPVACDLRSPSSRRPISACSGPPT